MLHAIFVLTVAYGFEDESEMKRIVESIGEPTIVKVPIDVDSNPKVFESHNFANSLIKVWGKRFKETSGGSISDAGVRVEDVYQVITRVVKSNKSNVVVIRLSTTFL